MGENIKWLYAFWRASRVLNDPAGRAIAKLDEWALTKLGAHANGKGMNSQDWLNYLRGAIAVLGVGASPDEAYREEEDGGGYFFLEDGNVKKRMVMWTPDTGALSLGVYWANMTRYVYAVLKWNGDVMVLTKAAYKELVKDLLVLTHAVAGEEWKARVIEAMGVRNE